MENDEKMFDQGLRMADFDYREPVSQVLDELAARIWNMSDAEIEYYLSDFCGGHASCKHTISEVDLGGGLAPVLEHWVAAEVGALVDANFALDLAHRCRPSYVTWTTKGASVQSEAAGEPLVSGEVQMAALAQALREQRRDRRRTLKG